jgi:thiamine biosynthesis lipoprotein
METVSYEFKAIGTSWRIRFVANSEPAEKIIATVKDRIAVFDRHYSRFRDDSLVADIARTTGTYTLPEDAEKMLYLYRRFYHVSNGKVTPLIGEVLVAAGYDKDYSLQPKERIPVPLAWDDVMTYDAPMLTTQQPVLLDFGALGKGYLVDIVADILKSHDIHDFLVNAGGDMAQQTTADKVLRVGLEDPEDQSKVIGIAELKNCSIAGSAGNRRKWANFHHIIDPDSGTSPQHIAALWVIARDTMLADGLATALFFMKPEALLKEFDFEYLIIYSDRSALSSAHFPAVLY